MKIGNIEFGPQPLFLAPMEDVTDIGFRMLCKRFGAAMVYTEFVSAEALVRSIKSTVNKLTISDEERPVGIQIYGRTTADMVEAAKIVEQAHPDVITFDYDEDDVINGDIVISLDTVRTNAEQFGKTYDDELHRVIIHGILHLCGINDKGPGEREIMEENENKALALLEGASILK